MWAHWRQLANMVELVLPSAHPSPQPKRQIDRFSRLCTSHGRKSLRFTTGRPFPPKLPFSQEIWTLIHDSLGHSEITMQTAWQLVQPFSHRWLQSVPILYYGRPYPPILPLPWGIWTLLVTRFLGPIQAHNPNDISISSAVFAQMTRECPYTL